MRVRVGPLLVLGGHFANKKPASTHHPGVALAATWRRAPLLAVTGASPCGRARTGHGPGAVRCDSRRRVVCRVCGPLFPDTRRLEPAKGPTVRVAAHAPSRRCALVAAVCGSTPSAGAAPGLGPAPPRGPAATTAGREEPCRLPAPSWTGRAAFARGKHEFSCQRGAAPAQLEPPPGECGLHIARQDGGAQRAAVQPASAGGGGGPPGWHPSLRHGPVRGAPTAPGGSLWSP